MSALREICRVLVPAGTFGMVWNIEDCESCLPRDQHNTDHALDNSPMSWDIHAGWETTIRDLTWSFDDHMPRFRHEKWRQVFEDQNQTSLFSLTTRDTLFGLPLGETTVSFETWLSKEDIWKRYRTLSQIAILQGEELQKVQKTFWDAIDSKDTGTDDQGRVAVHGRTFLAWTSKIPGEPLRSGG